MRLRISPFGALLLAACASLASAQTFPVAGRAVRVMVGFAAGGGTDIQARMVAPKLSDALGVPVIVENKPGASTMLAAVEVARAAPDGHTILYSFNGAFAQNPFTLKSIPYDPFKDFTPISLGSRGSQLLVVHQTVPVASIAELVAWGKTNPGKLNIASFGTGTSSHIFAEMLMRQLGVDMVHVPYKGAGDAVKDLLAGRVQLMFDAATTAVQNIGTGRLRALGVVAPVRSPFLPAVPTFTEQGLKGIDMIGWLGWYGPANLPKEIVQQLNAALVKALAHPDVKAGYERGAYEAVSSSPEELAALTRQSYEQWGKVIRELGIEAQ
ncbi:MAG: tripartite tricarboxylate transporter substrate binding protein [Betaproteobacteria bacterium]|nr:tripartite tricarboxylate transporter substrate binding protein [Betaproteobacteria bacterium]